MDAVATSFPKSKFAIVDCRRHDAASTSRRTSRDCSSASSRPATSSATRRACGRSSAAAAAVGSVGGIKIPPVDRYIAGFQYGAKKADPGIKTLNAYSNRLRRSGEVQGSGAQPDRAGSDVEFQVAGSCGLGVLDAAHSKNIFGIGVDADQGYLGPWVMTSALKKVDVAVYNAIKAAQAGKLKGGTNRQFGADVNGVGYGKWSPKVPTAIRAAVLKQYTLLKAGKITGIPTTVK